MEPGHAEKYVRAHTEMLLTSLEVERRSLEETVRALERRRDLALRRAAAAVDSRDAGAWMSGGSALLALKERLQQAADGDEDMLMRLVGEVRVEKERCTEEALSFYAERTSALLNDSGDDILK
jgi:hypothetical protein